MGQGTNVSPRTGKKRGGGLKKNSGHGSDHRYGRRFMETTCPTCSFKMKGSDKRIPTCGKCGALIPNKGFVTNG